MITKIKQSVTFIKCLAHCLAYTKSSINVGGSYIRGWVPSWLGEVSLKSIPWSNSLMKGFPIKRNKYLGAQPIQGVDIHNRSYYNKGHEKSHGKENFGFHVNVNIPRTYHLSCIFPTLHLKKLRHQEVPWDSSSQPPHG